MAKKKTTSTAEELKIKEAELAKKEAQLEAKQKVQAFTDDIKAAVVKHGIELQPVNAVQEDGTVVPSFRYVKAPKQEAK